MNKEEVSVTLAKINRMQNSINNLRSFLKSYEKLVQEKNERIAQLEEELRQKDGVIESMKNKMAFDADNGVAAEDDFSKVIWDLTGALGDMRQRAWRMKNDMQELMRSLTGYEEMVAHSEHQREEITRLHAKVAALKDGRKSRWRELFGTPERAARTLHCDKEPICAGCPLMDECVKTPDEKYDMCFLLDYDMLLEWLRGDAG